MIVKDIYQATATFPLSETRGLTDQIRRAAVSIPSNIAEGASRSSNQDFARFLEIALGSAFEVDTQIILAYDVGYIQEETMNTLAYKILSIQKQLTNLIAHIKGEQTM